LNPELIKLRDNSIIVTKNVINVPVLNKQPTNYILYEGIGHEADDHSGYLNTILRADENCYSINTKTGQFYNSGEKIRLVSKYQARNNRRVVISGSMSLCSNRFYFLR
jgi:oligosaccharyltransferase complex subunit beta